MFTVRMNLNRDLNRDNLMVLLFKYSISEYLNKVLLLIMRMRSQSVSVLMDEALRSRVLRK